MIAEPEAFIRANTRVLQPPHAPELLLHLADDAIDLWRLTEEELGRIGLDPPFWAFAWAGGQALARYLLDHPDIVAGKTAIDLACGSGLVAIAAKRAGAAHVRALDLDPMAVCATAMNAALNGASLSAETADAMTTPFDADVILVGDFFYERDLAAALLDRLQAAAAAGALVLVGDPGRALLPKHALEPLAAYEVATSRALEDAEVKRTGVWRLPAHR